VEVTVITCAPNWPKRDVYEGYKNKLWQQETIDGIRVIRVWSYIATNSGIAQRLLDYCSYAVMSVIASLFVKTDLIVATSPQLFTAVSGYVASVLKRKAWVMEVRDLWPESIRAVGVAEGKGKERLLDVLESLELFLYRSVPEGKKNSGAHTCLPIKFGKTRNQPGQNSRCDQRCINGKIPPQGERC